MKAVAIQIDVPPKYLKTIEDRDFVRVGQKLTGHVQLSERGRPKKIEIRWKDCRGRLLGRSGGGKYDAYNRRLAFEFDVRHNPFWEHHIECEIDGVLQEARATFNIMPTTQGWETAPAITWGHYPDGEFYDRLQEVGVNAQIAFKMNPFHDVSRHGMRFYIDNSTPDEISAYHRPHKLFWEPPAGTKPPYFPWGPGFRDNWKLIQERYLRMRERALKEGLTVSGDQHFRKLLWRDFCPNNPGTVREAGDRLVGVVRQHKGFRPLFYNMADEAGIADQTKAFDYCYCPHCMDKFRRVLEQKYRTLSALNAAWGTSFDNWDAVYPLTTDETMGRQQRGKPLNFASWNDHRAFMDDTFANFFAEIRRIGREYDPIGDFSQGGCQAPAAFGGWDYTKVIEGVDALIPYNIGGNQEAVRSMQPNLKNLSPFFGDDERHVRGLWYAYVHGDAGVVFWDADGANGRFVERPSGKLSTRGKRFGPALREIRGGYAQQFKAWDRTDDPIGLLYSQPSLRAHWLLDALDRQGTSEWFDVDGDDGRYKSVRMSWQQLIEDRQFQYRYVSYRGIDEDTVDLGKYRMLILPEAISISEKKARALSDFVYNGGVLVADGSCGRMDGNLSQVAGGMLDDLFGVRHGKKLDRKAGARLRSAPAKDDPWLVFDKSIRELTALDGEVRLNKSSGAEAAAVAGQAPAMVRRRFGEGWAVYLNADVHTYQSDRFLLDEPRGQLLRDLFDVLADLAGIEPTAIVEDHTLPATAGIEITRYTQAGGEMLVALGNRPFRLTGVGVSTEKHALDSFEIDREVTLHFEDRRHTYNSRTGEYLGNVDSVKAVVPKLTPLILSRLAGRVGKLDVQLPASVSAGSTATVKFAIGGDGPAMDHVVRVDVYRPDGTWAYWYSGTPTAAGGAGQWDIHLCLCSRPGRWKVVCRDTVTGKEVTKSLRVTAAK